MAELIIENNLSIWLSYNCRYKYRQVFKKAWRRGRLANENDPKYINYVYYIYFFYLLY
jgi:hypothetical protein